MKNTNKVLDLLLAIALVVCFSLTFAICVGASEIKVEKPEIDSTSFTYNGSEQEYKVAESEYYTVTNNKRTNAGAQDVVISLVDKEKYTWADGTTDDLKYTFNIQKATYPMQDVSFKRKEVIYDGNEHTLEIEGELPEGISVDYGENTFKEPGEYTVIAVFIGGDENYNTIAPKQAQLVIKNARVSTGFEEGSENDVIVSSEKGIKPSIKLKVEEADASKNKDVTALLEKYDKIACAYNIKLMINEVSQLSDGEVSIQIKLSEDIAKKDIRILHMGKESVTELESEKVEGYITFDAQLLKDDNNYVIVYDDSPTFLWLWIVLIVLAVVLVGGVILVMMIKAGKDEKVELEEEPKNKK